MKIKSITISRSNICSRMSGVIPCLVDSWSLPGVNVNCDEVIDTNTFSEYSSAVSKAAEYGLSSSLLNYDCNFEYLDNNYGMIVSDIIVPNNIEVTDYTDFYVNIPDEQGGYYDLNDIDSYVHYDGRKIISGDTEIKILTYTTLVKWYEFFKLYYKTKGKYKTASDFYEYQYEVKNPTDEQKYLDMDALFKARGGDEMYKWITEKCFVTFEIPEKYADEWKTTKLCYSEALKWQKWLSDRADLYSMPCEESENCCECNEFKKLGGTDILNLLTEWIDERKKEFENGFEHSLNSASYSIPILLTTSIDDLGQMSIFSSDWKDGEDYRNPFTENMFFDEENGGTVVNRPYFKDKYGNMVYDYDTFIIKNDETKGYKNNEFYENEFFYHDWYNYSDMYIRANPEKFATNGVNTYAYSLLNGKIIYNPEYDIDKQTYFETEVIKYNNKKIVSIDDKIIEVIDGEYIIPNYRGNNVANLALKTKKMFPVIVDGALKYVELNGKKYYVKKDKHGADRVYFLTDINCYDEGVEVVSGEYIVYNNNVFLVKGRKVVLEDIENKHYKVLDGYFEYNSQFFYIFDGKIMEQTVNVVEDNFYYDYKEISDEKLENLGWLKTTVIEENGAVVINHKLDISYSNKITGYTDSKLDLLRRRKINTDELGNELPGYFNLDIQSIPDLYTVYEDACFCDSKEKCAQFGLDASVLLYGSNLNTPYNECTLDLLYRVGEVSELKRFSNMDFYRYEPNEFVSIEKYYIGNYLDSIEFYYLDDNGNHINSIFVEGEDSRPFLKMYHKGGEKYIEDKILYCDITYYLDATLIDNGEGYELLEGDESYIKYVDTTPVYKSTGLFYMHDGTFFTFSYYLLTGIRSDKNIQDFNDRKYVNMSKFEFKPALYLTEEDLTLKAVVSSDEYEGSCLTNGSCIKMEMEKKMVSKEDSPWEKNNGTAVFPVFRQEYDLGFSTPQNNSSNIYIDRGINAAFEKHLKLMETHTLEALENYGNGYFKINKY